MDHADSFRDLHVYQLARQLAREVFEISKRFPPDEKYSLTDQVRRSSRSVGAQIAESWAKRKYVAHFVSKLTDADGEQQESQHWLYSAYDCQYITTEEQGTLISRYEQVGKMLQSMIHKADSFCG